MQTSTQALTTHMAEMTRTVASCTAIKIKIAKIANRATVLTVMVIFCFFPPIQNPSQASAATYDSTEDEIASSSFSQRPAQASLGMRQSPLGDSVTEPTLGPSGRQERLNCWAKKRR